MDSTKNSQYSKSDRISIRTEFQPDNVMMLIEEKKKKKGNKGYINLLKSLRGNDFDRDNYLFYKEWLKTLKEQRIYLKEKQTYSLFNNFCDKS